MTTPVYEAGHIKPRSRSSRSDMTARYEALYEIVAANQPTGVRFTYYSATARGMKKSNRRRFRGVESAIPTWTRVSMLSQARGAAR